ncbi:MAG: hypothetical protein GF383_14555 [Candidatus Lokiarchaeota archaeon]|nr:hypothetical protein [Candidatus Lokiarchaeota archaeon]MBD3342639.1 hypothetical protein [Candidatus Lokiarchaeota archaeon]
MKISKMLESQMNAIQSAQQGIQSSQDEMLKRTPLGNILTDLNGKEVEIILSDVYDVNSLVSGILLSFNSFYIILRGPSGKKRFTTLGKIAVIHEA